MELNFKIQTFKMVEFFVSDGSMLTDRWWLWQMAQSFDEKWERNETHRDMLY